MRIATPVHLSPDQEQQLRSAAERQTVSVRFSQRAPIICLAAAGQQDIQIAASLGITRQKASRWRQRFRQHGVEGLMQDAPRPGRKPRISGRAIQAIVRRTLHEKPSAATHWSTRSMAKAAGVSEASVRRIWKAHGLKPHRTRTCKLSNDQHFTEKLQDIIGLYLNPPAHALVLSCDEKSQIQALDRTHPGLPLKQGRAGTMTHDYVRHGTTTPSPSFGPRPHPIFSKK